VPPRAGTPGRRAAGRRLAAALGRVLLPVALAGLVAALAFLIAYPLWLFSSRSRQGFTIGVCAVLAALLLLLAVRRLRQASRSAGGFRELARRRILPALRTTGLVAAGLAALYGIALAVSRLFR